MEGSRRGDVLPCTMTSIRPLFHQSLAKCPSFCFYGALACFSMSISEWDGQHVVPSVLEVDVSSMPVYHSGMSHSWCTTPPSNAVCCSDPLCLTGVRQHDASRFLGKRLESILCGDKVIPCMVCQAV